MESLYPFCFKRVSYKLVDVCLPGIVPRIRTVGPRGKEAFCKGATPDLRRRRKRLNTRTAGLVMHAHCRAGELVKIRVVKGGECDSGENLLIFDSQINTLIPSVLLQNHQTNNMLTRKHSIQSVLDWLSPESHIPPFKLVEELPG